MLRLRLHPENPQARLIQQAVQALKNEQLLIIPTESCYYFAGKMSSKTAFQRLKQLYSKHDRLSLTLLCRSLSDISTYVSLDNQQFRIVKAHTPSAIEFILPAQKTVAKHLRDESNDYIAVSFSTHPVGQMLLESLDEPLLICPVILPNDDEPLADPEEIALQLEKRVDVFLDTGYALNLSATRVDLSADEANVQYEGIDEFKN